VDIRRGVSGIGSHTPCFSLDSASERRNHAGSSVELLSYTVHGRCRDTSFGNMSSMDRIVRITVIGRSISSRSKGMNDPFILQVVEPIRQVIHQRIRERITIYHYLLLFVSISCWVRRIHNFFYSLVSKSKRIWILFASYSHVWVYLQTPFRILRFMWFSKIGIKSAYSLRCETSE
jgi:hypothetical protein